MVQPPVDTRSLHRGREHTAAVFPADVWQAIMPHALMCYGASQLKHWSEYSPDGRERFQQR